MDELSTKSKELYNRETNFAAKGNNIWKNLDNDDPNFNSKKTEAKNLLVKALNYAEERQKIYESRERLRNKIYGSNNSNSTKVKDIETYKYTIGQIESRTQTKKIKISSTNKNLTDTNQTSNKTSNASNVNHNTKSYNNNSNLESIYDKKQREAREKENKKRLTEQKRLQEGQDFINRQNKQMDALIESGNKLQQNLANQFEENRKYWTKERDFNNRINKLTRIDNTSLNSIIAEVKQKSEAINKKFSQKQDNARKEGIDIIKRKINNSNTQLDKSAVALGGTIGLIAQQRDIEKKRRQAQQVLKKEQDKAEGEVIKNFRKKIQPRRDQYLQIASLAVFEDEEEYYLELYNYNNCLYENASSVLKGNMPCNKPNTSKPETRNNISGQNYYDSYNRKKNSVHKKIKLESRTLLEIAIELEPNKESWINEKHKIDLDELVDFFLNR